MTLTDRANAGLMDQSKSLKDSYAPQPYSLASSVYVQEQRWARSMADIRGHDGRAGRS
jgi:hypothetical protein